jgi:hypothetical protein
MTNSVPPPLDVSSANQTSRLFVEPSSGNSPSANSNRNDRKDGGVGDACIDIAPPTLPAIAHSRALGYNEKDEFARMRAVVHELHLTPAQKRVVMCRVLEDMRFFKRQYSRNAALYYLLNSLNVVGLTALPALLTLSSTDSAFHDPIFWSSFAISVSTGVSAAVLSFFQVNRNHALYAKLLTKMRREFYTFAALAEKYRELHSHSEAFTLFIHSIESTVAKTLAKSYDHSQSSAAPGGLKTAGTSLRGGGVTPQTMRARC